MAAFWAVLKEGRRREIVGHPGQTTTAVYNKLRQHPSPFGMVRGTTFDTTFGDTTFGIPALCGSMPWYKLLLAFPAQVFVPFHACIAIIYIYSFDLTVASDLAFDLTSLTRPYGPPETLRLGPGALPLDIALYERAFSTLNLILLAP